MGAINQVVGGGWWVLVGGCWQAAAHTRRCARHCARPHARAQKHGRGPRRACSPRRIGGGLHGLASGRGPAKPLLSLPAAAQADVAVDALARLVLNLKDGQAIPAEDAPLIEDAACGGFWDVPGFREEVRRSIAQREQRAESYA